MKSLKLENFRAAISHVNEAGFGVIDIKTEIPEAFGEKLYRAIDSYNFHSSRADYYNEISFYWPEDWQEVRSGLCAFHDPKSLKHILSYNDAKFLAENSIGTALAAEISLFLTRVKELTVQAHHGLANSDLKLARVMIRQMNERSVTKHVGSEDQEDRGYSGRPYRQLLSVILTTFGIPTESKKNEALVGEILIFNARDRRLELGLSEEKAFIHKGPKSGPKMFFFFEFLGPSQAS